MKQWMAVMVLGAMLGGCVEDAIRGRATAELNCPSEQLSIETLHDSTYRVQGCNASVVYTCIGGGRGGYACVRDQWGTSSGSEGRQAR